MSMTRQREYSRITAQAENDKNPLFSDGQGIFYFMGEKFY